MRAGSLAVLFFLIFVTAGMPSSNGIEIKESPESPRAGRTGNPVRDGMAQMHVSQGIRLLVFSPHPDDETLAAGGLIQRVLATGGKIRIVFITNGDGYLQGVRLSFKHTRFFTEDFIDYGILRHHEALNATAGLGMGQGDVVFLGFPDQGINYLRKLHWSQSLPYVSPYTKRDRPYLSSIRDTVKYCGTDLSREIERSIREFKPNWILFPDLRDRHPDHSATGAFVLNGLEWLSRGDKSLIQGIEVFCYLVHFPGYPESNRWLRRREIRSGPAQVNQIQSSIHWLNLNLSREEVAVKENALASYRSQSMVLGRLMREFIRPMEVFGLIDTAQISTLAHRYEARADVPAR